MLNMIHYILVGSYRLGLIDKVTINESVTLLADTATITLPGMEGGKALDVEKKLKRGDAVSISVGYLEAGVPQEFKGYVQNISINGGNITLECEDELFNFRKALPNKEYKNIKLDKLLKEILAAIPGNYRVDCSYAWQFDKFVIKDMTGYDVLRKIQDQLGADIYIKKDEKAKDEEEKYILHIHPPEEKTGPTVKYDFAYNIEKESLTYRRADEKKVQVTLKSLQRDGTIKEVKCGVEGGDSFEIICPAASSEADMKRRGDIEVQKYSYTGYEGSIDTWLVPWIKPGYKAQLIDADYDHRQGTYYVKSVTTEFSSSGGKRKVELGRKCD